MTDETFKVQRYVALFKGVQRSAGALLVGLAFIVVLMAASAQQEALRQLTAIDPLLDYSSAFKAKERMDQADKSIAQAIVAQQTQQQAADLANADAAAAIGDYNRAWAPMVSEMPAFAAAGCKVSADAAGEIGIDARQREASIIKECIKSGHMPNELVARFREIVGGPAGLDAVYGMTFAKTNNVQIATRRLAQAQANVESLATQPVKDVDRKVQQAFDATTKVRTSVWIFGGWLIDFPPALLQIILSFVSGAFGALLLILVLVVYPNTGFTVISRGGYGARTMLGGLISLCVFVMLGSGSAVLGSGPAGHMSGNYMAFCAIGILAGMFSDRVAAWLSARATTFFDAGAGAPRDPKH